MVDRKNDIYRIIRITGSQDTILGVCFSEKDDSDIEVIESEVREVTKIITSFETSAVGAEGNQWISKTELQIIEILFRTFR